MLLEGIQEAVGREDSEVCGEPSESLSERMSKQLEELESRFQILHSSILEEEEILSNSSSVKFEPLGRHNPFSNNMSDTPFK